MAKLLIPIVLSSMFLLNGCAHYMHGSSRYMKNLPISTVVEPKSDKANIVFIRPVGKAYRQASTVYDVTGEKLELIGVVPSMKKLVYEVDPGTYSLMVLGETTDYLTADVEAGKTYYARVVVRMGWWKARFSLLPIHKKDFEKETVREWLGTTQYTEPKDNMNAWFEQHRESIENKHKVNYPGWQSKTEKRKPHLYKEDGILPGEVIIEIKLEKPGQQQSEE